MFNKYFFLQYLARKKERKKERIYSNCPLIISIKLKIDNTNKI